MLKMCGPFSPVILAANTPLSIGVKTYSHGTGTLRRHSLTRLRSVTPGLVVTTVARKTRYQRLLDLLLQPLPVRLDLLLDPGVVHDSGCLCKILHLRPVLHTSTGQPLMIHDEGPDQCPYSRVQLAIVWDGNIPPDEPQEIIRPKTPVKKAKATVSSQKKIAEEEEELEATVEPEKQLVELVENEIGGE